MFIVMVCLVKLLFSMVSVLVIWNGWEDMIVCMFMVLMFDFGEWVFGWVCWCDWFFGVEYYVY